MATPDTLCDMRNNGNELNMAFRNYSQRVRKSISQESISRKRPDLVFQIRPFILKIQFT